jgi:hypothetical protein
LHTAAQLAAQATNALACMSMHAARGVPAHSKPQRQPHTCVSTGRPVTKHAALQRGIAGLLAQRAAQAGATGACTLGGCWWKGSVRRPAGSVRRNSSNARQVVHQAPATQTHTQRVRAHTFAGCARLQQCWRWRSAWWNAPRARDSGATPTAMRCISVQHCCCLARAADMCARTRVVCRGQSRRTDACARACDPHTRTPARSL